MIGEICCAVCFRGACKLIISRGCVLRGRASIGLKLETLPGLLDERTIADLDI